MSGTRVVHAPAVSKRPALALPEEVARSGPPEDAERIGPYHVIESLGRGPDGEWLLAYDTRLLRRVWVHSVPASAPPVGPVPRNLNRPGRLRWITGRRVDGEHWDAYEAPAGRPLSELICEPQSWAVVRFWLHDLAEELLAAETDGTTPEVLALDRVWITADGHAKLLDLPAPGTDRNSDPTRHRDSAWFLQVVATAAMQRGAEPVPEHARPLVSLDARQEMATLVEGLRLGVRRAARISRLRRVGMSLAVSAFPILAVGFWLVGALLLQSIGRERPALVELSILTSHVQYLAQGERREQLRRFLAHEYRGVIEDPGTWSDFKAGLLIDPVRRRLAEEALTDYPVLSDEEIEVATLAAGSVLDPGSPGVRYFDAEMFVSMVFMGWIAYAAVPALLMALFGRRGLILFFFGAAVVDASGRKASRWRALWRGLLAWSPFLVGAALVGFLLPILGAVAAGAIVLSAIVALVVSSHLRRERSLHDRLAGTWLVPK